MAAEQLRKEVAQARNELKNIRQQIETLKRVQKKEVLKIQEMVQQKTTQQPQHPKEDSGRPNGPEHTLMSNPIGYLKSCFKQKAGTPRQPSVCVLSKAELTISRSVFNNPEHSLDGIEKFSHLWIVFIFHKNEGEAVKAKVKPPRLDGAKVGVFATRSPHRPNPIGLTLAKLDRVEGDTLHLSGIDMLDGTPVLDIKPYIPAYDGVSADSTALSPREKGSVGCEEVDDAKEGICGSADDEESALTNLQFNEEHQKAASEHLADKNTGCTSHERNRPVGDLVHKSSSFDRQNVMHMAAAATTSEHHVTIASWVASPPIQRLTVNFTPNTEAALRKFHPKGQDPDAFTLVTFMDSGEAKKAICDILSADPRSPYFRNRCQDRLYFFSVDTIHVTCWFDGNIAEVIRVQPVSYVDKGT